jgi:hypothetical protein
MQYITQLNISIQFQKSPREWINIQQQRLIHGFYRFQENVPEPTENLFKPIKRKFEIYCWSTCLVSIVTYKELICAGQVAMKEEAKEEQGVLWNAT